MSTNKVRHSCWIKWSSFRPGHVLPDQAGRSDSASNRCFGLATGKRSFYLVTKTLKEIGQKQVHCSPLLHIPFADLPFCARKTGRQTTFAEFLWWKDLNSSVTLNLVIPVSFSFYFFYSFSAIYLREVLSFKKKCFSTTPIDRPRFLRATEAILIAASNRCGVMRGRTLAFNLQGKTSGLGTSVSPQHNFTHTHTHTYTQKTWLPVCFLPI